MSGHPVADPTAPEAPGADAPAPKTIVPSAAPAGPVDDVGVEAGADAGVAASEPAPPAAAALPVPARPSPAAGAVRRSGLPIQARQPRAPLPRERTPLARYSELFNDLLSRIADAGRALSGVAGGSRTDIIALCRALLTGKGEATGIALAREVIDRYQPFDAARKHAFFGRLAAGFGVDDEKLERAIAGYCRGDGGALRRLHLASEPSSLELLRRLNRAPGGTDALVAMRADLLDAVAADKDLECLDKDFRHLFMSWFNRGFLDLRRIDWSTSAEVLDRIIAYEAVHEITSWEDLRGRVSAPDRRLYGFFHPSLANEPLIFVEVALTTDIPATIDTILAEGREAIAPAKATTATFYSISNCQKGLRGISFGNFLIKQVVEELRRELPGLRTFVTLSPVPGLRRWAAGAVTGADPLLSETQRDGMDRLADGADPADADAAKLLREVAARYLVLVRSPKGGAVDPVARFHLGNGARLERINCAADHSARGLRDSWGVMVNYRYALDDIERNHESYVSGGDVACSSAVRRLL